MHTLLMDLNASLLVNAQAQAALAIAQIAEYMTHPLNEEALDKALRSITQAGELIIHVRDGIGGEEEPGGNVTRLRKP